jgi:hypothetical protein
MTTFLHDSVNDSASAQTLMLQSLEATMTKVAPETSKQLEEMKNVAAENNRETERWWASQEEDAVEKFTYNLLKKLGLSNGAKEKQH